MIIPFFEKYPLVSQKRADFELFKQIVELINNKEHLTPAGLQKIVNLKAALNLGNSGELKVLSIADINKKIIPFFSEYQLQGVKSHNFADFRSVAQIMEAKGHLTTEGLEQIQAIKMGMNKGRVS